MAGPVFRTKRSWSRRLKQKIRRTFYRQLVQPRVQRGVKCPLSGGVQLRAGRERRFHQRHEAKPGDYLPARQHLRRLVHLHRSSEQNQRPLRAEKLGRRLRGAGRAVRPCHLIAANGKARVQRLRARREVSRPRHLNAANAQANPARRRRLISVLRRRNMADHLRASQARVQVRVRQAVPGIFRRNRATGDRNVRDSVLRHQQRARVQVSRRALSIGHRRDFVSLVASRQRAVLPAKRVGQEKEARAVRLNLVAHPLRVVLLAKPAVREKEAKALLVNLADRQGVERLLEPSTAKRGQRAERKSLKEEHHRQGHNKFWRSFYSGSGEKTSEPLFFANVVGRLYQTPADDLFIVGKAFLVWPLFPVRDQTSSNWILANAVPLFVN